MQTTEHTRNRLTFLETHRLMAALDGYRDQIASRKLTMGDVAGIMTRRLGFEVTIINIRSAGRSMGIKWPCKPGRPRRKTKDRLDSLEKRVRKLMRRLRVEESRQ